MNKETEVHTLIADVRARLELAFSPRLLEISDESHHHVGHVGAEDGKSHLRLRISSQLFESKTLIMAHREIYDALEGLMQTRIHALKIQVIK